MFTRIRAIDFTVFDFVQHHQQPLVLYAARDLTSLGGNVLVVLFTFVCAFMMGLAGEVHEAISFAGLVGLTAVVIYLLKVSIGRPCPLQPDPYQCCKTSTLKRGPSFPLPHLPCMPSGHTMGSTVMYGLMARIASEHWPDYHWHWAAWGVGLPIAIGISRIILSAHWTSDVLVGFGLGHGILLLRDLL